MKKDLKEVKEEMMGLSGGGGESDPGRRNRQCKGPGAKTRM